MITEQELLEAIAECQGQRNPNANTCIKLASFYTILDHMSDDHPALSPPQEQGYSFASEPVENSINYDSGTEFSDAVYGKPVEEVMGIVDELMSTLSVLNPPLYNSVMRRVMK